MRTSTVWGFENPHNPTSVNCHNRYILCLAGCPIISEQSKLQLNIALSTMEAKYITLSMVSKKELLRLQCLAETVAQAIQVHYHYKPPKLCVWLYGKPISAHLPSWLILSCGAWLLITLRIMVLNTTVKKNTKNQTALKSWRSIQQKMTNKQIC